MRVVYWILRALVFLVLLAFALSNQQTVAVHGFFGARWEAPMVIVLLATFVLGVLVGIAGMFQVLWRRRRAGSPAPTGANGNASASPQPALPRSPEHPPRDGV